MSEVEGENRAIVCDNGTGMIKAGYAGEDAPSVVFQALWVVHHIREGW